MSAATVPNLPPTPVPLRRDAEVIGLVGLAHATSHFSHLLLAPFFPFFMQEFGLGYLDVGWLMTTFFLVSGLGQACSGFVVDRVGARPVLFIAISLFLVAALVASQATGYWSLIAVAILAGAGNAPFHPVDFTILNQRVSAPRLGHAFSVHGLTGNLGWAFAPVFLMGVAAASDWRVAYQAAVVLYAIVIGVLWWQRDKLRTTVLPRKADMAMTSGTDFLKLPVVWWCFAFFFLSTMTLAVVQSFGPSLLRALHGVSLEAATYTVTAYMLCGAVGMLVGGFVAAKHQRADVVVTSSMGFGALLLLVCATGWLGALGTMACLAATGFAVGVGGPSRDMMIKRATPVGATGRVYGTVYSGLDLGFAVSPVLFGALMDKGHYALTLVGAALFLAGAVVAARSVGRRTLAV